MVNELCINFLVIFIIPTICFGCFIISLQASNLSTLFPISLGKKKNEEIHWSFPTPSFLRVFFEWCLIVQSASCSHFLHCKTETSSSILKTLWIFNTPQPGQQFQDQINLFYLSSPLLISKNTSFTPHHSYCNLYWRQIWCKIQPWIHRGKKIIKNWSINVLSIHAEVFQHNLFSVHCSLMCALIEMFLPFQVGPAKFCMSVFWHVPSQKYHWEVNLIKFPHFV